MPLLQQRPSRPKPWMHHPDNHPHPPWSLRRLLRPAIYAGAALQAVLGLSEPEGGVVMAGSADISTSGSDTLIRQHSDSAIINWDRFGVAAAEQVRFVQPDAGSWILNRDLSGATSQIHGAMLANGRVFIQNRAGVLIGRDASIDVGSFVATAANIANDDFMSGDFRFLQGGDAGAAVTNLGTIEVASGGMVALIGGQVANDGVIRASAGTVALAAAETFTLDFDGDGLLHFAAESVLRQSGGVEQSGEITAETVLLTSRTAEEVLNNVVNLSGVVRAVGASGAGGRILLHAGNSGISRVSGTADASGNRPDQRGGEVDVLGHKVVVEGTGVVDASGSAGGGRVRIGGDFQGNNPEVQNAEVTGIGPDAEIRAGASEAGDGGRVIVWADGVTRFYGTIDASGAGVAGTGGFVEVSGKAALEYRGDVDIAGEAGGGSLLLDPTNITLVSSGNQHDNISVTYDGNYNLLSGEYPPSAVLDPDFIDANADVTLQASHNLYVAGNFSLAASVTNVNLHLRANNSLSIGSAGAIAFSDFSSVLSLSAAVITGNAAATALSVPSDLYLAGSTSIHFANPVIVDGRLSISAGGTVKMTNTDNNLGSVTYLSISSDTTLVDGIGNFILGGALGYSYLLPNIVSGSLTVSAIAGGIYQYGLIRSTGRLSLYTSDVVVLNSVGNLLDFVSFNPFAPGAITVTTVVAGNQITGPVDIEASSATLSTWSHFTLGTNISVSSSLSVSVHNEDGISGYGTYGIYQTPGLPLTLDGNTTLRANGPVVLNNTQNRLRGPINIQAVSATLVNGVGDITLGSISTSGALLVSAASGGIYQSQALALTGNDNSLYASGAVVLTHVGNDIGIVNISISAGSATLVDGVGNFTLGSNVGTQGISVSDSLTLSAISGGIYQDGPLVGNKLGKELSLYASGAVVLDNVTAHTGHLYTYTHTYTYTYYTGNSISSAVNIQAYSATLLNTTNITLGNTVSVSDSLTLSIPFTGYPIVSRTIGQSGVLKLYGDVSLLSDIFGRILLENVQNDLDRVNGRYGSATLVDGIGNFTLGGRASGNLLVRAIDSSSGNGGIYQSGALVLDGNDSLYASGAIVLNDAGNNLNRANITAKSATLVQGVGNFTLGYNISVLEALAVRAVDSSSGNIYQSGTLVLDASLSLYASGAVVLNDINNNFVGPVRLEAVSATLVDGVGDLTLETGLSVPGALLARAVDSSAGGGGIYQSGGALTLGANHSLFASGAVVLDDLGNDLGLVNLEASSATLVDGVDNFTLGSNLSVPGSLTVHAMDHVGGTIFQSGALVLNQNQLLHASGAVILGHTLNNLNYVNIEAPDATLVHGVGHLTLGPDIKVTVNTLTLSAIAHDAGDISQSNAPLEWDAQVSLYASGAVVLNNALNRLRLVHVQASSATLVDGFDNLTLGAGLLVPGQLSVRAIDSAVDSGGIYQSGGLTLGANHSLYASGAVVLDDINNDFIGPVQLEASSATLVDGVGNFTLGYATRSVSVLEALVIRAVDSTSGNGNIYQSEALSLNSSLSLYASGAIVLDDINNNFVDPIKLEARSATLVDGIGNVTLGGHLLVTDSITVRAVDSAANSGEIHQSGALTLDANLSLYASGAVVLTHTSNDLGLVNLEASSATLVDGVANLTLGRHLSVPGPLSVRAVDSNGGNINQSGALTLDGNVSLYASGAVVLDNTDNDIHEAHIDAHSATLVDGVGDFTLGDNISVSDVLSIRAVDSATGSGGIYQSRALVLNEKISLYASGAVVLTHVGNDIGLVNLDAPSATLFDSVGDFTLSDNVSVTDALYISVANTLTQSGALTLGDNIATLHASVFRLDHASNDFIGRLNVSLPNGGSSTIVDRNTFTVGPQIVNARHKLSVQAADIVQSGAIYAHVTDNYYALFASDSVSLDHADNEFRVLHISAAGNVFLRTSKADGIARAYLADVTADTLTYISENKPIGQLGNYRIRVSGDVTLSADNKPGIGYAPDDANGGVGISLTNLNHSIGGAVRLLTPQAATLYGANLTLDGASSVGRSVVLRAAGDISQRGALTLDSNVSLYASSGAVVLDDINNDFIGPVQLEASSATLVDGVGNFTLGYATRSVSVLEALVIRAVDNTSGNGNIYQSEALSLNSSLSLYASGAVVLDDINNDFIGPIQLEASSATLVDGVGNFTLEAGLLVPGQLSVRAIDNAADSGGIYQSGGLTLGANHSLFASGAVVLDDSNNDFIGPVQLEASSATLVDGVGNFTLGYATRSVSVLQALVIRAVDSTSGNGNIYQSEALNLNSSLSLYASGAVVLDDLGNDLGLVNLEASSATLVDGVANFTLGRHLSVPGSLSVRAVDSNGGNINQSGVLTLDGNVSLYASGAVVLDNTDNDIHEAHIDAHSATLVDGVANFTLGNNISVIDLLNIRAVDSATGSGGIYQSGALVLNEKISLYASGAVVFTHVGNDIDLVHLDAPSATLFDSVGDFTLGSDNVSVTDALYISVANTLTQSGALTLGDNIATLHAGVLRLDNASNDFIGRLALSLPGAGSSTIVDRNTFTVGPHIVNAGHKLSVQAIDIVQSGAISAHTQGHYYALFASDSVSLDHADNEFRVLHISAAGNVFLRTSKADGIARAYLADITADTLTYISENKPIGQLGNYRIRVSGDVTLSADNKPGIGYVPDDANGGVGILLTNLNHSIGGAVRLLTPQAATLYGANLTLDGASSVGGSMVLRAAGDISQRGALTLDSNVSLYASSGPVVLDDMNNDFIGPVWLEASSTTLVDGVGNFTLGYTTKSVSVLQALVIRAVDSTSGNGNIYQSEALTLNSSLSLYASGAVVLDDMNNDFIGPIQLEASSATLVDGVGNFTLEYATKSVSVLEALVIRAVDSTSGNGNIYQSEALTLNSSLSLYASGAIVLDDINNNFVGPVRLEASSATLVDGVGDLTLETGLSVPGALLVRAVDSSAGSGGIYQSGGSLTLDGNVSLYASGAVVLTDASNNFGLIYLDAESASLVDSAGDLTLSIKGNGLAAGGITASGNYSDVLIDAEGDLSATVHASGHHSNLTLWGHTIAGAITVSGERSHLIIEAVADIMSATIIASGTSHMDISAGGSIAANITGGDVLIGAGDSITGTISAMYGDIHQWGILTLDGNVSLYAAGTVYLDHISNELGSMQLTAGSATLINGVGNFTLGGNISVRNSLVVRAINTTSGNIYQSGALTLGGPVSLSAFGAIVLTNRNNDLNQVNINANTATLVDGIGDFLLGGNLSADSLTIRAVDTLSGHGNIFQLGALTLLGNVSLYASGALVLTHPGNDLGLANIEAQRATLVDGVGNFTLGPNLLVTDSLTVSAIATGSASGTISQSGPLTLDGSISLYAVGAIQLTDPSNDLGQVNLKAANATLVDGIGDIVLGNNISVSYMLTISAINGDITQPGTGGLTLAGKVSLFASGSVLLYRSGNNLNWIEAKASKVDLANDYGPFTLGGGTSVADSLNIKSRLGIYQSGALTLGKGKANNKIFLHSVNRGDPLVLDAENSITLDNIVVLNDPGNDLGVINIFSPDATVFSNHNFTLGAIALESGWHHYISVSGALVQSHQPRTLVDKRTIHGVLFGGDGVEYSSSSGGFTSAGGFTIHAGSVTLTHPSNDIGIMAIRANSATLVDGSGNFTLGTSLLVTNALTVSAIDPANGAMHQAGALTLAGKVSLFASGAVLLDRSGNNLNWIEAKASKVVLENDYGPFTLGGGTSVADSLNIDSKFGIYQSGALTLGKDKANNKIFLHSVNRGDPLVLDAENSITLDNIVVLNDPGNDLGVINIFSPDATVFSNHNFTLGAIGLESGWHHYISVSGALVQSHQPRTLVDGRTIHGVLFGGDGLDSSGTGGFTSAGGFTIHAGSVTLTHPSNDIGIMAIRANSATLVDGSGNFTLGTSLLVTNALTVSAIDPANGAMHQSGALTLGGNISLYASGALVLTHPGNDLGLANIEAQRATLVDGVGNFTLGANLLVTDSLTVSAIASGTISQSGPLTLDGSISLYAVGAIQLTDPSNDLGQVNLQAANARLVDGFGDIVLGNNISVSDMLTMSAINGDITQPGTGGLTLAGKVSLFASGAVLLNRSGNNLNWIEAKASKVDLANDYGPFTLGGGTSVADSLNIDSKFGIYQSGALNLGKDKANNKIFLHSVNRGDPLVLDAENSITLDNIVVLNDPGNDLGVINIFSPDATVFSNHNFTLGAIALESGWHHYISVSGALVQSHQPRDIVRGVLFGGDGLDSSGTGGFTSAGGFTIHAGSVTLTHPSNDIGIMAIRANSATLVDGSGNFTLGTSLLVTNALTVSAIDPANGAMHQSGALTLAGKVSLFASGAVLLDRSGNNLNWIEAKASKVVLANDYGPFTLGGGTSVADSLNIDSKFGIYQSGALTLGKDKANNKIFLHSVNRGDPLVLDAENSITLDNIVVLNDPGNDLGVINIFSPDATVFSKHNFTLGAIGLESGWHHYISVSGALVQSHQPRDIGGGRTLRGVLFGGDGLEYSSGTGGFTSAGGFTIHAGSVTLTHPSNDIGIMAIRANSATLVDGSGNFTLGTSLLVTNALTVSAIDPANGAMHQSGALTLGGNISLYASGALVLTHPGNDLGLANIEAQRATLVDGVGNFTLGGNASVVDALYISVANTLTQSGALTLGDNIATLHASVLRLDNANNDFIGRLALALPNGGSSTIVDRNTFTVGPQIVNAKHKLSVQAADIVQSGAIYAHVTDNYYALFASGSVSLDHADNEFRVLHISAAGNVFLRTSKADGIARAYLADVTADTLTYISENKPIGQLGNYRIRVSGDVTLSADNKPGIGYVPDDANGVVGILLTNLNHSIGGAVRLLTPQAATLYGADLTLDGASSVGGSMVLSAAGDISQSGALSLYSYASLMAAGAVVLNNTANDLGLVSLAASSATLVDGVGDFTLGRGISVINRLAVTALDGDISQSGALVLTGDALLSTSGAVVLDNAGNDFGGIMNFGASGDSGTTSRIHLVDANDLTIGYLGEVGSLSLTAVNVTLQNTLYGVAATTGTGILMQANVLLAQQMVTLSAPGSNISLGTVDALDGTTSTTLTLDVRSVGHTAAGTINDFTSGAAVTVVKLTAILGSSQNSGKNFSPLLPPIEYTSGTSSSQRGNAIIQTISAATRVALIETASITDKYNFSGDSAWRRPLQSSEYLVGNYISMLETLDDTSALSKMHRRVALKIPAVLTPGATGQPIPSCPASDDAQQSAVGDGTGVVLKACTPDSDSTRGLVPEKQQAPLARYLRKPNLIIELGSELADFLSLDSRQALSHPTAANRNNFTVRLPSENTPEEPSGNPSAIQ